MSTACHLSALQVRLSNERNYLAMEKSEKGKELRRVWILQIEREIEGEKKFLGMEDDENMEAISDDELMAALLS